MKYWICVGTTLELPTDGSFISRTAMGVPVVIQRFGDEISCFLNACAHRGSELKKPGSQGCGPLKCPYHGWQFGRDGSPTSIPSRSDFCEADQSRRLVPWSVELVGTLIFVAIRPSVTIEESLGEMNYRMFADITSQFGDVIDDYRRKIAAPWHVVVENTLEAYHVPFVHADSIARMKIHAPKNWRSGSGSSMAAKVSAGKSASAIESLVPELADRAFRAEGYMHAFAFPNFTIASTHGMTFALQFIEPAMPGTNDTNFRTLLYSARVDVGEPGRPLVKAIHHSAAQMNRQTFDEDAEICEGAYRGSAWAIHGFGEAIGANEERVMWFREEMARLLS